MPPEQLEGESVQRRRDGREEQAGDQADVQDGMARHSGLQGLAARDPARRDPLPVRDLRQVLRRPSVAHSPARRVQEPPGSV